MVDLAFVILGVMAVGLAGTLLAERAERRGAQLVAKPVASLAFVALAVASGATGSTYGLIVLAGLVLSLAGDVLLVWRDARIFRAGIFAFLLAHLAYLAAFSIGDVDWVAATISTVALIPAAILVGRWILPGVGGRILPAVVLYIVVISAMMSMAAGASVGGGPPWLVGAALLFYLSDVLVARDRFVERRFWHRAAGLPMYYAAQALFALSVAAPSS